MGAHANKLNKTKQERCPGGENKNVPGGLVRNTDHKNVKVLLVFIKYMLGGLCSLVEVCMVQSLSSSYFLLLLVLLHHPFSLPPVVFLFITITIISHLAPPCRPLEPHLTPSLALVSSLTTSPDGCRGEAGLTLILAPVAQCRKPLTSQRGLAVEVAVWFPVGPSAICRHTPHRSRRHRAQ